MARVFYRQKRKRRAESQRRSGDGDREARRAVGGCSGPVIAAFHPPGEQSTETHVPATSVAERPPAVVAIVLNWNNLPDTLEAVESLLASDYRHLAVWVVDNDSLEDPRAELRALYPGVRVLRNARNSGYGGGNNVGLKLAIAEGAEYVLLLNNDAVVAPDMVRHLVSALETDARIAMATPTVFYSGRPSEVYWDGGFVDWKTGDTPHDSRRLSAQHGIVNSEWLDGCALLVRAVAAREIGLLDERYFLYFEDAEWSVRAGRRGWMNVVVREGHAWHKVSRSTGGTANPAVRFYYLRNRYLFMKTHHPAKAGIMWRVRYLSRIWREYVVLRHDLGGRQAVIAAFVSLLRGRWGPYDLAECRRRAVRVLDGLLTPVRKCLDPIKRAQEWFQRLRVPASGKSD